MFTTNEHKTIVTLLAAGKPVWYVAAVAKAYAHDVYTVGVSYGYPDPAAARSREPDRHRPGCRSYQRPMTEFDLYVGDMGNPQAGDALRPSAVQGLRCRAGSVR